MPASFNVTKLPHLFTKLFTHTAINSPDFPKALTATLAESFRSTKSLGKDDVQALVILEQLFFTLCSIIPNEAITSTFTFSTFISQRIPDKKEANSFMTAILYGLYFRNINLYTLYQLVVMYRRPVKEQLELIMIQLAAESISPNTLQNMIVDLSLQQRLYLILLAFTNYREGSYHILTQCALLHNGKAPVDIAMKRIIEETRKFYFDHNKLHALMNSTDEIDEKSIPQIAQALEEDARQQTEEFAALFQALIPLMISSPVRVFEAIQKVQVPGSSIDENTTGRKEAEENEKRLKQTLGQFNDSSYTFEQFHDFVKIFGSRDQQPYYPFVKYQCPDNSLVEKTKRMLFLFREPFLTAQTDGQDVLFFFSVAYTIIKHMNLLHHRPSQLRDSLGLMTCAIPTKGKALKTLPSLFSIARGLRAVVNHLDGVLPQKTDLKNYPVFVFDQSDAALFRENCQYITELNRQHNCSIIHVSYEDALALAKRIGVDDFLDTTGTGSFGYGGMRNSVFFLAPVLKQAFKSGCNSLKEVLTTDSATLNKWFREHVLDKSDDTIFMCDDDMEIPEANIFSHLLFTHDSKGNYTGIEGLNFGRDSKVIRFPSLQKLLDTPIDNVLFPKWLNYAFETGMSEQVLKPKCCLNLPFGAEEGHVALLFESDPFNRLSIHLSGPRFPSKEIPTHFFIGLHEPLKKYIPYSLLITMAQDLLDPLNRKGVCVFPWNSEKEVRSHTCLRDVLQHVSSEGCIMEMKQRFWRNVHELFYPMENRKMLLRDNMNELINMDIAAVLKAFQSQEHLDKKHTASLEAIGDVYRHAQQDAIIARDFGLTVLESAQTRELDATSIETCMQTTESKHHIARDQFPLTHGLCLMFKVVGCAEFDAQAAKLL